MEEYQEIFKRTEKKYILDKDKYESLMRVIPDYFDKDKFYKSRILSLYYDTDTHLIVRNSIEKPVYKEKLRLRSYGVPKDKDSIVFPEIKKKFKGIVYKRRTEMPLCDAEKFLSGENVNTSNNPQIENEIQYFLKIYDGLAPSMLLCYDRLSFAGKQNNQFRLTLDSHIRYREDDLSLESGDYGKPLLSENTYVMEVKIINTMPVWFSEILSKLRIFPAGFSKYGKAYENEYIENNKLILT